ncbi:phosphatidylserine decarboxylase family protein [Candidatus Sumerlaeota bacterium]|nr:phosphatidylserine decarboxylase family protein [Candidatus Sumerlaeota bacterium]
MKEKKDWSVSGRSSFLNISQVGWRFILPAIGIGIVFFIVGIEIAGVFFLGVGGGLIFFFRDPERHTPRIPGAIVSPADGKVLSIKEVSEESEKEMNGAIKVSIFMSLFNVHVNRSPLHARVIDLRYRPGKFYAAFSDKASERNEANFVYLQNEKYTVLVKQIAGIVARRIICPLRIGQELNQGERIGLICFGSRVELYIPASAQLRVKKGQRVRAGESVIAILPSEELNDSFNRESTA